MSESRTCAVDVIEFGFVGVHRPCGREAVARLEVRRPAPDGSPGFTGPVCARHRDEAREAYDGDVLDVAPVRPPLRLVT